MIDLLAVVCVRILLQAGVQAIAPRLPFFITRNARDVVEYLALDDALRLRFFDGEIPLVFPLTWFVQQIAPELPAVTITKSLILAADIIAAVFWYFSIRMIQELGLNRNDDVEGYSFASSPWFVAALFLLNPFSVLYNYVCNADGMLCFWVSFAVFAALNVSVPRAPDFIPYIIYQVAASGLVINGSFKMYAVLPALAMVAAQKRLRDDVAALTSWRQLKHVLSFLFPHIFVTLTIVVFYFTMHNESVLKRAFEVEYTGRGSGINYSLYWYPHRILPTEFTDINLLKSHMMIFLLPLPLIVLLHRRPMECLIVTLGIALIQHPNLSVLRLWFMICLLAIHYPLLDKSVAFTKLVMAAVAALCISMVAHVSWVENNFANANHLFGTQMVVFITLCMVLEDYVAVNFLLSNRRRQSVVTE